MSNLEKAREALDGNTCKVCGETNCEVREWVNSAHVGCYGNDAGKTEAHAKTLEGKGYKVTRAGKALVVTK